MDIALDSETDDQPTLRLADTFRLTTYDAAYLELAQRRNLPLASLDRDLLIAAEQSGIATVHD